MSTDNNTPGKSWRPTKRVAVERYAGMTSFKLSKIVGELRNSAFRKSSEVSQHYQKSMLRALCDRYPNVWASLATNANDAGCGETQARHALRELLRAGFITRATGHTIGGRSNTNQYLIEVPVVVDALDVQRAQDGNPSESEPFTGGETPRNPSLNPSESEPLAHEIRAHTPRNPRLKGSGAEPEQRIEQRMNKEV